MFLTGIRHLTYSLKHSMCSIHINLIIRWFSLWSQSLNTSNMKIISNKLWSLWYLSWLCTLRCNFNIVYIPLCRDTFQAFTHLYMHLLKNSMNNYLRQSLYKLHILPNNLPIQPFTFFSLSSNIFRREYIVKPLGQCMLLNIICEMICAILLFSI